MRPYSGVSRFNGHWRWPKIGRLQLQRSRQIAVIRVRDFAS